MKALIKTGITETIDKLPYLANQAVSFGGKVILDATTCLCRVAGTPAQIADILADASITEQTDDQARTIIQSNYPDSDLENIDIPDLEIDEIAKTHGLDPRFRADIQFPTRGKQVLQDQENYLLAMISAKKGKSKKFWDDEAGKSGKYPKGIDIENGVIDGNGSAHEFVLSRLR